MRQLNRLASLSRITVVVAIDLCRERRPSGSCGVPLPRGGGSSSLSSPLVVARRIVVFQRDSRSDRSHRHRRRPGPVAALLTLSGPDASPGIRLISPGCHRPGWRETPALDPRPATRRRANLRLARATTTFGTLVSGTRGQHGVPGRVRAGSVVMSRCVPPRRTATATVAPTFLGAGRVVVAGVGQGLGGDPAGDRDDDRARTRIVARAVPAWDPVKVAVRKAGGFYCNSRSFNADNTDYVAYHSSERAQRA